MNAALCFATENHGSRELGAQARAAADVHLSVPPIRALPLLRGDRPHDCFRLSVRRGEARLVFAIAVSGSANLLLSTSVFSLASFVLCPSVVSTERIVKIAYLE